MKAPASVKPDSRRWESAQLLGSHEHTSVNGHRVTVVQRNGKFMARGRIEGTQFCETLGATESEAAAALRRLLSELDSDSYLTPMLRKSQQVRSRLTRPLVLPALFDEYLREVRKTQGQNNANNYRSRLTHVLAFASKAENSKRWRTACDINRDFIIELKAHLVKTPISPNGHPHSKLKPMSERQIYNVLSALSSMLRWAQRPDIQRLPPHWANPITRELLGNKPSKDPFRLLPLVDDQVIQLINHCDRWQLCHLALSFLFPLRPEEAAGLLVEDIDFDKKQMRFGTRFGGGDYTKGKQCFVLPFPIEIQPILRYLIGQRSTGPLLRQRQAWESDRTLVVPQSTSFGTRFEQFQLQHASEIDTAQDRKRSFRQFLITHNGVRANQLAKEFKKLAKLAGLAPPLKLYDMRAVNTTKMNRVGLTHLELCYFTGHTTADIINVYAPLDPHRAIQPYFKALRPLLNTITEQLLLHGIVEATYTEDALKKVRGQLPSNANDSRSA